MSAALARFALSLYPLAHRRRYGAEMSALVADTGASPRVLADLARGALRAHLRPEPALAGEVGRYDRVRLAVSTVLFCWVLFGAAVFAFAKTTEERSFRAAADAHGVLGGAHLAIQLLAILAGIALVCGAAPLGLLALANLRRPAVRRATLLAAACVLAFVAASGAVVLFAHGHPRVGHAVVDVALAVWTAVALACALGCAGAARRALFATPVPEAMLRFSVACAVAVVVAMAGVALAVAVYLVALLADAPALAAEGNGPGGHVSVALSLAAAVAAIAILAGGGSASVRRALARG